jgi:hypothetical protein
LDSYIRSLAKVLTANDRKRLHLIFLSPALGGKAVDDTELLTTNQLAERLHLRPRTVQAWARLGRIPTVKLSPKVVRFDWPAVLAVLREQAKRREASHAN